MFFLEMEKPFLILFSFSVAMTAKHPIPVALLRFLLRIP